MNWESEKDMARDVEENEELYQALADEEELKRRRGTCIECRESWDLKTHRYIKYGGGLWCSEECLAEWAVRTQDRNTLPTDIDKVEEEYEVVND